MLMKNADINWGEFDPYIYLKQYYETILDSDREIVVNLVKFYKKNQPKGRFLEVGCGPNLFPVFVALPYADKIDIVEFGEKNIIYLRQQFVNFHNIWLQWIDLLKKLDPIYKNMDFNQCFRQKVVINQDTIFDLPQNKYEAVSMHFVTECLTGDLNEFNKANRKFVESIKPGGIFFASFMENSQGYDSPGKPFPAVAINADDVRESMSFLSRDLNIQKIKSGPGIIKTIHTGILVASGHKDKITKTYMTGFIAPLLQESGFQGSFSK
jgi:hypothetical protein